MAKEFALSPFCFLGKCCAQSLLRGDLLIDKKVRKPGKILYRSPTKQKMVSRVASAAGNQQERYVIF